MRYNDLKEELKIIRRLGCCPTKEKEEMIDSLRFLQHQRDTGIDEVFGEEIERFIWSEAYFNYGIENFESLNIEEAEERKSAVDGGNGFRRILKYISDFDPYDRQSVIYREVNKNKYITFFLAGEFKGLGLTLALYRIADCEFYEDNGAGFICYLHKINKVYRDDNNHFILRDRKAHQIVGEKSFVCDMHTGFVQDDGFQTYIKIETDEGQKYHISAETCGDDYYSIALLEKDEGDEPSFD